MRTSPLISFVSAAALMGALGVASAAQTDMPPPSTYQQPQATSTMSGMQMGMTEQVASDAAAVLRRAGQSSQMQSPSMPSSSEYSQSTPMTGGQIPSQFVSAAKCVVVFPSSGSMNAHAGMTSGTTPAGGTEMESSESVGMNATAGSVGVASCRDDDGNWTSTKPAFVKLSMNAAESETADDETAYGDETDTTAATANTGDSETSAQSMSSNPAATLAQPAASGSSLVLLFVDDDAADDLMSGGLTLGDDADVAAGPVGETMDTNSAPAAILAYSETAGSGFSGAEVKGATIDFDEMANKQAYGEDVDATDLLQGDYEGNGQIGTNLTAYNQALSEFAPASQYKSKSSIAK